MISEWRKKFSLGLVMDTTLPEFEEFLHQYNYFIDNFYFSLPLGNRFHSRKKVAEQFKHNTYIEQFWVQLKMIHDYGIKLELLFNTHNLSEEDILNSKNMLENHGIYPDKIGLVDENYSLVKKYFPRHKLVYSFNNSPASIQSFHTDGHTYSEYVIGRQFIRSHELVRYIHETLRGQTVLLLNNGCSHICGGCSTQGHCADAYRLARKKHSAEYLYALQSIFPFELHEGYISLKDADLLKINSRNTNIRYLRNCIESYIYGDETNWIQKCIENYGLWGHLTWHMRFYSQFDLERIKALKRSFYSGQIIKDYPDPLQIPFWVDLSDHFIYAGKAEEPSGKLVENELSEVLQRADGRLDACCIGIRSCSNLLRFVDLQKVQRAVESCKQNSLKVYFTIPPLSDHLYPFLENLLDRLKEVHSLPDGFICNDWNTFTELRVQGFYVLRGTELDMRQIPAGGFNSPCLRDMLPGGVPSGMQGENAVVRFPLRHVARNICPFYSGTSSHCSEHCVSLEDRLVANCCHSLHNAFAAADEIQTRLTMNDDIYTSVVESGATVLYVPNCFSNQ